MPTAAYAATPSTMTTSSKEPRDPVSVHRGDGAGDRATGNQRPRPSGTRASLTSAQACPTHVASRCGVARCTLVVAVPQHQDPHADEPDHPDQGAPVVQAHGGQRGRGEQRDRGDHPEPSPPAAVDAVGQAATEKPERAPTEEEQAQEVGEVAQVVDRQAQPRDPARAARRTSLRHPRGSRRRRSRRRRPSRTSGRSGPPSRRPRYAARAPGRGTPAPGPAAGSRASSSPPAKERERSPWTYASGMPRAVGEQRRPLQGDPDRDQDDVGEAEHSGDLPELAGDGCHGSSSWVRPGGPRASASVAATASHRAGSRGDREDLPGRPTCGAGPR